LFSIGSCSSISFILFKNFNFEIDPAEDKTFVVRVFDSID